MIVVSPIAAVGERAEWLDRLNEPRPCAINDQTIAWRDMTIVNDHRWPP
jgi:hypothetical protein